MEDCKANEKTRPEFAEILERFKGELNTFDENSDSILAKTCQLRDFREVIPQQDDGEKSGLSDNGIIAELDECIRKMRDYNFRLIDIKNGLTKIIG